MRTAWVSGRPCTAGLFRSELETEWRCGTTESGDCGACYYRLINFLTISCLEKKKTSHVSVPRGRFQCTRVTDIHNRFVAKAQDTVFCVRWIVFQLPDSNSCKSIDHPVRYTVLLMKIWTYCWTLYQDTISFLRWMLRFVKNLDSGHRCLPIVWSKKESTRETSHWPTQRSGGSRPGFFSRARRFLLSFLTQCFTMQFLHPKNHTRLAEIFRASLRLSFVLVAWENKRVSLVFNTAVVCLKRQQSKEPYWSCTLFNYVFTLSPNETERSMNLFAKQYGAPIRDTGIQ